MSNNAGMNNIKLQWKITYPHVRRLWPHEVAYIYLAKRHLWQSQICVDPRRIASLSNYHLWLQDERDGFCSEMKFDPTSSVILSILAHLNEPYKPGHCPKTLEFPADRISCRPKTVHHRWAPYPPVAPYRAYRSQPKHSVKVKIIPNRSTNCKRIKIYTPVFAFIRTFQIKREQNETIKNNTQNSNSTAKHIDRTDKSKNIVLFPSIRLERICHRIERYYCPVHLERFPHIPMLGYVNLLLRDFWHHPPSGCRYLHQMARIHPSKWNLLFLFFSCFWDSGFVRKIYQMTLQAQHDYAATKNIYKVKANMMWNVQEKERTFWMWR